MIAPQSSKRRVLVFGAGNIGLSFVGQIFHRAGYHITFADTATPVLRRLSDHNGYSVRMLAPNGKEETVEIRGVETVDPRDTQRLSKLITDRPLIATAVGARAFPIVLQTLRTAATGTTALSQLDIVAAENIHDPRAVAEETLGSERPGVHGCSVGKMVPIQDPTDSGAIEVRAEAFNTLIVDGTDWRTPQPKDVEWIEFVADIRAWMDRKLYVHNLGHATCAWRARAFDPTIATVAEAIAIPEIRDHVEAVMHASAAIVGRAYPHEFDQASLDRHVADLLYRFGNPKLGDTVERVGQDLHRKLAREERLVGAMLLAARAEATEELTRLATVATDAIAFGIPGVSQNPDDIALTERARMNAASPTTDRHGAIQEIAKLDAQRREDARVLEALQRG